MASNKITPLKFSTPPRDPQSCLSVPLFLEAVPAVCSTFMQRRQAVISGRPKGGDETMKKLKDSLSKVLLKTLHVMIYTRPLLLEIFFVHISTV